VLAGCLRLSTTQRINSASDDPSGLFVATKLQAQIGSSMRAIDNINQGVGMLQSMDRTLGQIASVLADMRSLAISSASITSDRVTNQTAYADYMDQVDALSNAATWSGHSTLAGGGNVKVSLNRVNVADINQTLKITLGGTAQTFNLPGNATTQQALASHISAALAQNEPRVQVISNVADTALTFISTPGIDLTAVQLTGVGAPVSGIATAGNSLNIQVGPNAGQTVSIGLLTTLSSSLGNSLVALKDTLVSSQSDASTAMSALDSALATVSAYQSYVGAKENIMSNWVDYNTSLKTVNTSAYGSIVNADLAAETTRLASAQIKQSGASAMLTQSNLLTRDFVSSLLRGVTF
jgi:flagellin